MALTGHYQALGFLSLRAGGHFALAQLQGELPAVLFGQHHQRPARTGVGAAA